MSLNSLKFPKKTGKSSCSFASPDSKVIEGVSLRRRTSRDECTNSYKRFTISLDHQLTSPPIVLGNRHSLNNDNILVAVKRKSLEPLIPRKSSKSFKSKENIHDFEQLAIPDLNSPDSPAYKSSDIFLFRNNFDNENAQLLSNVSKKKIDEQTNKLLESEFQDVLNYLETSLESTSQSNSCSDHDSNLSGSLSVSTLEDSGEYNKLKKISTIPASYGSSKKHSQNEEKFFSSKRLLFRRSLSECESKSTKKSGSRSQSLKCRLFRAKSTQKSPEPSLFKGILRKSISSNRRSKSDSGDAGSSPWHSRRSEDAGGSAHTGGSAPTSPQTASKLQKLSFWKRGSTKQDKSLNASNESLPEKETSPMSASLTSAPTTSCSLQNTPTKTPTASNNLRDFTRDDEFRKENSLKIRIQEAKGVPDKRRYHCVLLINGKETQKTSTKLKNGLCFWGEHFEIFDLQEVKSVGIKLIRDDKKTVGLGEFKPVASLQNPKLDEWIKVISEKTSKEKTDVAVRIRYTFRCVTILPLCDYKCFSKYLNQYSLILCKKLETQMNAKAKEDFLTSLVTILHDNQKATSFMGQLIKNDVDRNEDNHKTMFRANSMATKAIEAYMRLVGESYLENTLLSSIKFLLNTTKDFEVDACKISPDSTVSIEERRKNLLNAVQEVWLNIVGSAANFPEEIRSVFFVARENLRNSEMADRLISASVFLRLLCPSVMSPTLFGLTKEYPDGDANRRLTLVAKTLQTLANFSTFQSKEDYMQFLNPFIEREQDNCRKFLLEISSAGSQNASSSNVSKDIYVGRHLALLHLHLKGILETMDIQTSDSDIRHLSTIINHVNDRIVIQERLLVQRRKKTSLGNPSPYTPLKSSPKTFRRSVSEAQAKKQFMGDRQYPPYTKTLSESEDSRRKPATDLSTSDNYVLQSVLAEQRFFSRPNDNDHTNNNVNLGDDIRHGAESPEPENLMTKTGEQRHKHIEKSLSTHQQHFNDIYWATIDNDNAMRGSRSSLTDGSTKSSSGYHSFKYSSSTSSTDSTLLPDNISNSCANKNGNFNSNNYSPVYSSPVLPKLTSLSHRKNRILGSPEPTRTSNEFRHLFPYPTPSSSSLPSSPTIRRQEASPLASRSGYATPRTNPHCSPCRIKWPKMWRKSPSRRQTGDKNEQRNQYCETRGQSKNYGKERLFTTTEEVTEDDHMQIILRRLLTIEEEMRREQYILLQKINVKDRLLTEQERCIAALDSANSELIRTIVTLTASHNTESQMKTSSDSCMRSCSDQEGDLSLESCPTSDFSDDK